MSDAEAATPRTQPPAPGAGTSRTRRVVLALVGAMALGLLAVLVYTALPRWWSQKAGAQVDGSLSTGLVLGFMYGFLGILLPAAVLVLVYRFFRGRWLAWAIGIATALVLAGPNLLTLWIAVGTGDAAHAADRTLDVKAPWFRGGMLSGVIAAAVFIVYAGVARRRARRGAGSTNRDEQVAAAPGTPPPAG